MSRRRKPRDRPTHSNFDPSTAPGRWHEGTKAPRRPYAGPGGRGQFGHQDDRTQARTGHRDDRTRTRTGHRDDRTRTRAGQPGGMVEDTSPSRYSRQQQQGRPRPPRGRAQPPQSRRAREPHGQDRRTPPAPQRAAAGATIDPFDLFCAYHLGITTDGGYRIQNIHEVARRFGTNAAALKQTLGAYGMEADDIVHSGFDLPGAQIDIMVAPEGISRRELARPLYEEFKAAPRQSRDWARELEEAEREIERTIGADGRWSPGPRDAGGKQ